MPIDKIIRIDLDGRPAINELKKVRGEIDITYAELRRSTPIDLDGGKAAAELKKVSNETKKTVKETK